MYTRYHEQLQTLTDNQNLRHFKKVPAGAINLSSNDYLGLRQDQALRRGFIPNESGDTFLYSASSSRLLTGNDAHVEALEALLAQRFKREAALVFNSGYHANLGILPALTDKEDLILADKQVHASLIDGMRLAPCDFQRYRHNDYNHLEHLLKKHTPRYRRVFVVTESVFSMDGDKADLRQLVALKERYGTLLYVDEAHAIGIYGQQGLGLTEAEGVRAETDFIVGTFGKALASQGAYLICDAVVRKWLINHMRSLIFTTALPPISVQWTHHVVAHLPQMEARRAHLHKLMEQATAPIQQWAKVPCVGGSHIVPFVCGSNEAAMEASNFLLMHGFYALPVRHPTVPKGTARLRLSLHAGITKQQLNKLMDTLKAYVTTLDS